MPSSEPAFLLQAGALIYGHRSLSRVEKRCLCERDIPYALSIIEGIPHGGSVILEVAQPSLRDWQRLYRSVSPTLKGWVNVTASLRDGGGLFVRRWKLFGYFA